MGKDKKAKNGENTGLITLFVCGILAMAIIVGCVFFSDEIFGIILNK